ncbi:acyl carrier protein, partial [Streptomyces palmae]|uniref:acyl carrier protein n=1 Tax=Streptomyces palmae TaxID=1701085 RepID=UPI001FD76B56
RNKLSATMGMSLPTTLIFDYPTADGLAGHLLAELSGDQVAVVEVVAAGFGVAGVGGCFGWWGWCGDGC